MSRKLTWKVSFFKIIMARRVYTLYSTFYVMAAETDIGHIGHYLIIYNYFYK